MNKINVSKIHKISGINFWLGGLGNETKSAKWAVFFGEDFKDESGLDRREFIRKANQCFGYIRKNCGECELIYKPHPAETREREFLDLSGFRILENCGTAELLLWENASKIKYVFAIRSTSALSAHQLGFNSYLFYKFFGKVFFSEVGLNFIDAWFKSMPEGCFIKDMEQKLLENKIVPADDPDFVKKFRTILQNNSGAIWIIVDHSGFLVQIISLSRLLKDLDPSRRLNLILVRHRRWNLINPAALKSLFDSVVVFPRLFYSLRPAVLLNSIKSAKKIKNFNINQGDVIVDFGNHNFISNCFISYHKKNFRIAFLPKLLEDVYFKTGRLGFLDNSKNGFSFTKASFFYNKLLEPFLGLNRTIFKQYGDGHINNLLRFQRPLDEIYDLVYFF